MKHLFLLDENIIRFALDGGVQEQALLDLIASNCHRLALDSKTWGKYQRHFSQARSNPRIVKLLSILIRNEQKREYTDTHDLPDDIGIPENTTAIPRKDQFLIPLAFTTKAVIVAEDGRLLAALRQDYFSNELAISSLTLDEAMEAAQDS